MKQPVLFWEILGPNIITHLILLSIIFYLIQVAAFNITYNVFQFVTVQIIYGLNTKNVTK